MLTLAILNFNGNDSLRDSIQSVLDQTHKPDRFVVIDNASTDGSRQIAVDMGVEVVDSDNRFKFITGLNTALSLCEEWLFFMQNDVVLKKDCLENLFLGYYAYPFVQPLIYQTDGEIDNAGMEYKWPGYGERIRKRNLDIYPIQPTDVVCTIAFLISKKIIDRIGDFDENFKPAYYEDLDYSLRVRSSERLPNDDLFINKPSIALNAVAIHRGNHTFSQTYRKDQISWICLVNRNKLIEKHYRGIDKFLRLAVSTCGYVMAKTIGVIREWWVAANKRH